MRIAQVSVTLLFAAGLFIIFGIDAKELFFKSINLFKRPQTMKNICRKADGRNGNFITKKFVLLKDVLKLTGREKEYDRFVLACAAASAVCAAAAAIAGNYFLVPVAALIGLFLPILYACIASRGYRKQINTEIQTSMSIVTLTYSRTQNLLTAVSENVDYLHEPVRAVFKNFLSECDLLTSNVEAAIRHMKGMIQNDVWKEWCEALILCQRDRANIDMLDPIITKMRNIDSVQTELDAILYKPVRDFLALVILMLVNFPIIYFLNKDWWRYLVFSVPGKIAVTITFGALLFALFAVMRAIRPLEYKR